MSEISLDPTEDLNIDEEDFPDAQSDPKPSHNKLGADMEEKIEEGEELSEEEKDAGSAPPRQLRHKRSNRIKEISQSPLEKGILGIVSSDDKDSHGDVNGDNNTADIPATQLFPRAPHLCSAAFYRPNETLKQQKTWGVKPVGLAIPASATPFGECLGASRLTFYRSFSMLRDTVGNDIVTRNVGDTVLIGWERQDPKEDPRGKDQAVCRIMCIFIDPKDKVMKFIPQWGRSWSDVLLSHSNRDTIEPDDDIRGSKEIFWEAEVGSWPNVGSKPLIERGLEPLEFNDVHNITRLCVVRHRDEFETEEELHEFLSLPDTYFYRYSLPHAGPLRWEELVRPCTVLPEKKRLSGPLRMVDVFCGSGAVSCAAIEVGWNVTTGVESNFKAFQTYIKNAALAAKKRYKVQDFLRLVKEGTDPDIPRKGEIDWLHLSPPCQSLCSQNAHKGVDRYTEELIPLLSCIRELILELECPFITIEEVPRFLYAEMPKVQFTKRKKAAAATAAAANNNGAAAANVDDELVAEDAVEAEAEITDGRERLPVRAWLHIVPALLINNWQVDMRLLNSAHYGCPQERPRLFLFAARRGYELPSPPAPIYHSDLKLSAFFKRDPNLATLKDWGSLAVHSDPSLPPAVTSLEAIDDLPLLLKESNGDLSEDSHPCYAGIYFPRNPNCISRYVTYIRQDAPGYFVDHLSPKIPRGDFVDPALPFGTIIGQDDKWSKSRHYSEPRALSVLERRRGQSFPDKMELEGGPSDKMKIVGNAVPYLLARAIASTIMVAATGNPSSAPPLPNLKGWIDAHGNEVDPPLPSEYDNRQVMGLSKSNKKRRMNPMTANVTGTAEQEDEEEVEVEAAYHDDDSMDGERDEEGYEGPDNVDEAQREGPLENKKDPSSSSLRQFGPVRLEDKVEVRSFAGKKFATPMKMQKIHTFFSPHHELPVEFEQREWEQRRQREQRQLAREQQRQLKEEEEKVEHQQQQHSPHEAFEDGVQDDEDGHGVPEGTTSDDLVSIKPVEPFALYNGNNNNNDDEFEYSDRGADEESSGRSSAGVAAVDVIDLTMISDDEIE
jgi:site-specific DNA-cytosine methylase